MGWEELVEALTIVSSSTKNLLDSAVSRADDDVSSFVEKPKLGGVIKVYSSLYSYMGGSRGSEALEEEVKRHFKHQEVQDAWEEVLEVETAWDNFLTNVDTKMRGAGAEEDMAGLGEGDVMPSSIHLKDVRTEKDICMGKLMEETESEFIHLVLLRHFA